MSFIQTSRWLQTNRHSLLIKQYSQYLEQLPIREANECVANCELARKSWKTCRTFGIPFLCCQHRQSSQNHPENEKTCPSVGTFQEVDIKIIPGFKKIGCSSLNRQAFLNRSFPTCSTYQYSFQWRINRVQLASWKSQGLPSRDRLEPAWIEKGPMPLGPQWKFWKVDGWMIRWPPWMDRFKSYTVETWKT